MRLTARMRGASEPAVWLIAALWLAAGLLLVATWIAPLPDTMDDFEAGAGAIDHD